VVTESFLLSRQLAFIRTSWVKIHKLRPLGLLNDTPKGIGFATVTVKSFLIFFSNHDLCVVHQPKVNFHADLTKSQWRHQAYFFF
jgi:hypothetical protein